LTTAFVLVGWHSRSIDARGWDPDALPRRHQSCVRMPQPARAGTSHPSPSPAAPARIFTPATGQRLVVDGRRSPVSLLSPGVTAHMTLERTVALHTGTTFPTWNVSENLDCRFPVRWWSIQIGDAGGSCMQAVPPCLFH
jgi:hypothetical protein